MLAVAPKLVRTNRILPSDRAVHDWYRFVLSFPPHLVQEYLTRFQAGSSTLVLDPFCGTGTVLVECKKRKIPSVGIEANPIVCFASRTKLDWSIDPDDLLRLADEVCDETDRALAEEGIRDTAGLPLFAEPVDQNRLRRLPEEQAALLLRGSMSPLPLHRTLLLLEAVNRRKESPCFDHARLALAKTIVFGASNLAFGPEVGVGPAKQDAAVGRLWRDNVRAMADDIRLLRSNAAVPARVLEADSREVGDLLPPLSVDVVITSPPYPNEKDYTRTTRLESVLLGFTKTKSDLRALKQALVKSNTRGVYKSDRDDALVEDNEDVLSLASAIEKRREELGKTSGFERLYARVTKLYFGGMTRHLSSLRSVLRPGAHLAYVVGDQASYLRVMIRTGEVLADIASSLGFRVESVDLFRKRLATATGEQLREEVVVLEWPGWQFDSRRPTVREGNNYSTIIEHIFLAKYKPGMVAVDFERQDLVKAGRKLGVAVPKNLGDVIYSFRYRSTLPAAVQDKAGTGKAWIIRPTGRAKYRFALVAECPIAPNASMAITKVPDCTPGVVAKYAFNDEQALLARVRYNRLVDIFSGVTCYSLQNHLRTAIQGIGQVETDEIYVGVDKKGAHYVFPVQAKGGSDRLNVVQIEQDFAVCAQKFPSLICRPIAAQFMADDVIALFEFEQSEDGVRIASERHYKLVPPDEVTEKDLESYRRRQAD